MKYFYPQLSQILLFKYVNKRFGILTQHCIYPRERYPTHRQNGFWAFYRSHLCIGVMKKHLSLMYNPFYFKIILKIENNTSKHNRGFSL